MLDYPFMTKAMIVLLSMPVVSSHEFVAKVSALIPPGLHSQVAGVDKQQLVQTVEMLKATAAASNADDPKMVAMIQNLDLLKNQIK